MYISEITDFQYKQNDNYFEKNKKNILALFTHVASRASVSGYSSGRFDLPDSVGGTIPAGGSPAQPPCLTLHRSTDTCEVTLKVLYYYFVLVKRKHKGNYLNINIFTF